MAYATLSELRTYLKSGASTTDDTLLTRLLATAQRQIDSHCRRWFEATTATRYYGQRPVRTIGPTLYLDADLLSVTTLTNGEGTVISSTNYWLEPRNEAPYNVIRLKTNTIWNWTTDGEISVAGSWGYSTTAPEDVRQACLRLAAFYYKQKDAQVFDVTADPTAGVLTIPQGLPADVKILLETYVRRVWA